MPRPVSLARIEELIQEHGHALWLAMSSGSSGRYGVGARTAAKMLRCNKDTAMHVMRTLHEAGGVPAPAPIIGEAPAEAVQPVYSDEELIDAKIDRFRRKQARQRSARLNRRMWLPNDLPVGILHIGDPHLDDDGCDLQLLRAHLALVRATPGLHAGCLGDVSNNWLRPLMHLWADQHTDKADEKQLIRWFLRQGPLLYFITGNHDKWNDGYHYLKAAISEATAELGQEAVIYLGSTELELTVMAPNGESWVFRIRHSFKGRSMWNPSHQLTRDAIFRPGADILVQGHLHNLAIQSRTLPSGQYVTAVQVNAYKRFDSYAEAHQFPEHEGGEAVLTILDPLGESAQARTITYADPFAGAHALTMMRRAAAERLCKSGKMSKEDCIAIQGECDLHNS